MREAKVLGRCLVAFALALPVLAGGCGASDSSDGSQSGQPGATVGTPGVSGVAPTGVAGAAGFVGSPGALPVMGTQGSTAAPATSGVPCAVATVVSNNCTTCHASVPAFGAPMPLITYADFHAQAKTDPSKKVYELIPARIKASEVSKRMPPASQPALAAADLQALDAWVSAGAAAAAGSQACAITPKSATGIMGTGSTGATAKPATHTGGASSEPIQYNDPQMKCYQFLSHASGDTKQPFSVDTTPDLYTNFDFAAPWQGTVYARSLTTVIGNMQVIHHWILYKDDAPVTDGTISTSTGAHPNGQFVQGWAPGGSDIYLDPDVGMEMPSNVGYTLETHHNNGTGGAAPDASGVEVCVTPTAPKNIASIAFIGTDSISGTTATGTCTPTSNQVAHIIGGSPHMHPKGTRMSVIITRANGMTETLHDQPFDFNYQHSYADSAVINPGDSLATTCYYNAPATFGSSTKSEMCYFFTLYYPPLALTNNNPLGVGVHGPNSCM
jgi:hypothetical protein